MFKYHVMLKHSMEVKLKPCSLCSKLPNYRVLNKRLVALAYGRALRAHHQIAKIYNLGTYFCMLCTYGRHEKGIIPHVHFETYHSGCCCPCHWGLKPTQ